MRERTLGLVCVFIMRFWKRWSLQPSDHGATIVQENEHGDISLSAYA